MGDGRGKSILVVEDDEEMRERILLPAFREAGFDAQPAASAAQVYRQLLARRFDVIVLDVGLPDEDGFTILKHLRAVSSACIVMLTGRSSGADRVRGLDQGADAYLAKPVEMVVLLATIRSVLRRMEPSATSDRASGQWRLNAEVWAIDAPDGTSIPLSQGERSILQALFASAGEVVTRERLIEVLARDDVDFDPHRMEMLVHRLRRKVLAACGTELPLRTVRGAGYVLALGTAG